MFIQLYRGSRPAGPLGTTSTGAALCQLDTAGRLSSSRKPPGARKQMFVEGGSGPTEVRAR